MTPAEVAEYLNISRASVYNLLTRRVIPSVRIGELVRVESDDLEKYVKEHKKYPDEDPSSEQA